MNKDELIKQAHEMYAYEISEQSDIETHSFDDLWQSLYDICQIGSYGIVDLEEDELKEAVEWLKISQSLTEKYKETEIYF